MTPLPTKIDDVTAGGDPLQLAREHYENFPVGSWLLPAEARKHLHRIYAFARTADDIADEWRDAEALAAFRRTLHAHLDGVADPREPLFVDLVATVKECDLPVTLLTDLLDAFDQDLEVSRYADDVALLDYCTRSADPVGRLVLRVWGHRDDALDQPSDRICTALQLVNHLQDIRSDLLERDRIYFPQDDLERHGVKESDLRAATASDGVRALVKEWTDRCAAMLLEGWPLTQAVSGRLRIELRAIVRGASAVIDAIRSVDHDVLGQATKLGKRAKLGVMAGALLSSRPPRAIR